MPDEQIHEQIPGLGPSGVDEDTPAATIRIVLADDHAVVRSGLRLLLDARRTSKSWPRPATSRMPGATCAGTIPTVLVLDLNMPGGSSLEAIPTIREESPDTQIVVLTMQEEPAFARHALGAGALGYVLKEAADDELVQAVRRAAAGETYMNPRLGARLAPSRPRDPRTTSPSARSTCCA